MVKVWHDENNFFVDEEKTNKKFGSMFDRKGENLCDLFFYCIRVKPGFRHWTKERNKKFNLFLILRSLDIGFDLYRGKYIKFVNESTDNKRNRIRARWIIQHCYKNESCPIFNRIITIIFFAYDLGKIFFIFFLCSCECVSTGLCCIRDKTF